MPRFACLVLFPLWWILGAFLLAQAGFAAGLPLTPLPWALGWAAAAGTSIALGFTRRDTVTTAAICLAGWLGLSLIAGQFHDFSWDGQAYHQEAIVRLAAGWNPWRGDLPVSLTPQANYISGYPKAAWIGAAMALQIFGHIEPGKAAGWLIAAAVSGMTALAVARLPLSPGRRRFLALLVLANPVAICEFWTFMVDGWVAWTLTGAAVAGLCLIFPSVCPWNRRCAAATFAGYLLLLASVKLTGLVFAVLFGGAVVATLAFRRADLPRPRRANIVISLAAFAAAGALCLGQPYGTNLLRHGNPLWPAAGANRQAVMLGEEHPAFLAKNGPVKFWISANARTRNIPRFDSDADARRYGEPVLKPPFAVAPAELHAFIAPDVHIGGLGPWFGGVFLAGAVLLGAGAVRGWPSARPAALLWCVVLASVLIIPEAWWLRFVPQVWWLAILPLAVAFRAPRPWPATGNALAILLLINTSTILAVNLAGQAICERAERRQMAALAETSGHWQPLYGLCVSFRQRFHEQGFETAPVTSAAPGQESVRLIRSDTVIVTGDPALAARLRAALPERTP